MGKVIQFPGFSRGVKITVFYDPDKEAFDIRADNGMYQGQIVGTTSRPDDQGIYMVDVKFEIEGGKPVIKGTYLGDTIKGQVFLGTETVYHEKYGWAMKEKDENNFYYVPVKEARMVDIYKNFVTVAIKSE